MIIPPLLTLDGKMSQEKLEKKEYYFTKFLHDCLRNSDLKGCYFLQEFLSLTDDKLFGKVMKDREKDKQPEILKNYYSVAGEHKVQSTLETWRYCLKVPEFIDAYKVLNNDIIMLSN